MTPLPQVPPPRCTHFQSKSLIVHGEGYENDPAYQGCGSDVWCLQTARPLGPDNGWVGLKPCSNPDRDCYQEY